MSEKIFREAETIPWAEILEGIGVEKISEKALDLFKSKLFESGEKDSGNQGELQREKAFSDLANTFDALGVQAPYNNSEQLFSLFGEESPGMFSSPNNYLQVVAALKNFLDSATGLMDRDPDLPTDSVKYIFDILQRSAFNIEYTVGKINDLAQKASDPFADGYVISILKGNFALASVFLLMQNLTENGKFDNQTFKDMSALTEQANKILGTPSAELTDAIALQTAKGKANFAKIVKDRNFYQAMIPLATEAQNWREGVFKFFGGFYNSTAFQALLNDPTVKLLILGSKGFKAAINGMSSSSFGEATSNTQG